MVCSDWPAFQCVAIGQIPQACDGNIKPLTVFGNTQRLHDMTAAATILLRESNLRLSLHKHLGSFMQNLQIFQHCDINI